MWFSHVNDLFITNPGWQCWFTSSSITPLIVRCEWCKSLRFLVSVKAKVFKALDIISHWIYQSSKDWRSEFILSADTAGLESTISMRQASSAYNLMAHAKFITMSFKCTRQSKGPKIEYPSVHREGLRMVTIKHNALYSLMKIWWDPLKLIPRNTFPL